MSGALLAGVFALGLLMCLWLAIFFFTPAGMGAYDSQAITVSLYVAHALLVGVACSMAWRRQARWWAGALALGFPIIVAEFLYDFALRLTVEEIPGGQDTSNTLIWMRVIGLFLLPILLLAFALFGPRRELQRLYPPRIYRPKRTASPQPR
jgi:hypothetical protein